MKSDLQDVKILLDLSLATFLKIRYNFAWAFSYNILTIPIAAGLFPYLELKPWIAGLLMALSSVSVVTNSLFLAWFKPCRIAS
jgi:cation transport ATPase